LSFSIVYAYRKANQAAHSRAKFTSSQGELFTWGAELPTFLDHNLAASCNSNNATRANGSYKILLRTRGAYERNCRDEDVPTITARSLNLHKKSSHLSLQTVRTLVEKELLSQLIRSFNPG
jgi:hypothetical protein